MKKLLTYICLLSLVISSVPSFSQAEIETIVKKTSYDIPESIELEVQEPIDEDIKTFRVGSLTVNTKASICANYLPAIFAEPDFFFHFLVPLSLGYVKLEACYISFFSEVCTDFSDQMQDLN